MSTPESAPTPPPTPPEPGECCHSGCTYCVEDLYMEALAAWRALPENQPPATPAPKPGSGLPIAQKIPSGQS